MSDWREGLDSDQRRLLQSAPMPTWMDPMLATLTDDRFSSPDWIFERKLDGVRCLVFKQKNSLRILSRNQQNLNDTYPELVDALADQPAEHYVADGEIVAFDGRKTSFSRLQGRLGVKDADEARDSGIPVYLYLFDMLYLEDHDLTQLPLRTRKSLLKKVFRFSDPLRFTPHRNADGEKLYEDACQRGWEGLIAKKADGRYVHSRSTDWLKFKCVHQQELVVIGFTDPKGARQGFGALLLGYYSDDQLCYAGKVGTGFDDRLLRELRKKLQSLVQSDCPLREQPSDIGKDVHWVEPKLVAEIGFTEWTSAGRLRHPRFLGVRHDKEPREVLREDAA